MSNHSQFAIASHSRMLALGGGSAWQVICASAERGETRREGGRSRASMERRMAVSSGAGRVARIFEYAIYPSRSGFHRTDRFFFILNHSDLGIKYSKIDSHLTHPPECHGISQFKLFCDNVGIYFPIPYSHVFRAFDGRADSTRRRPTHSDLA
jgi:hypothetical protein